MPASSWRSSSRLEGGLVELAVSGEGRDERGEGAAEGRLGGHGSGSCVGSGRRLASRRRLVIHRWTRSRTSDRKSVMPGGPGSAQQPVRRQERSGHVGRAVTRRDAQLERLTRAVEADDVHARVAAGAEGHHLQHVGIRRARALGQARLALGRQVRQQPLGDGQRGARRTVGLACGGAARRRTGRSRGSAPKRRAASSASSPKRTAARLNVGATTAAHRASPRRVTRAGRSRRLPTSRSCR